MYLSRLELNPRNRGAVRDLASPHDLHRTLWRAFPDRDAGGAGRVMFRVEPERDADAGGGRRLPPIVLVQSEKEPDWSRLPAQWAGCIPPPKLVTFTHQPGHADAVVLRSGDRFRFRLTANPVKKVVCKDEKKRRVGLLAEEDQRQWLARKADAGGFRVIKNSLLVVPLGTLNSRPKDQTRRNDQKIRTWYGVRFEGGLEVVDPAAFAETLTNGVGPAKAFGFGLLSIMRNG